MKLVEILARELKEWPGEIDAIVQRSTGGIYLYGLSTPISHIPLANDWALAIVTKGEWEAERERIALEQATEVANKDAQDHAWINTNGLGTMLDKIPGGLNSEEFDQFVGKRSKEDQELWDKVAVAAMSGLISCDAFHGRLYQQNPENAAIFGADCADAFMAERAKRMK